MEKILLAMDASHPDKNATEFACYLAMLTKSKLTGVFLEKQAETSPFSIEQKEGLSEQPAKITQWFAEKCINQEARYSIYSETGIPAKELADESRYADLVVIDAKTSFQRIYEGSPTKFVRDFLHHTECPVVIAPESFGGIAEIVFAYDASPSAAFAIKQFSYLFPQFNNKKITVAHVSADEERTAENEKKLTSWLNIHYTDVSFASLLGEPDNALFAFLLRRKNAFVVMGAYGRSAFSQFLKRSRADLIIKTITHPIFIAHR